MKKQTKHIYVESYSNVDKQKAIEMLLAFNECLLADGFDDAIIGISQCSTPKAVYCTKKCVEILMKRDKMTEEEAVEFFQHNVVGSYMGEKTPIFTILKTNLF
tara:strand:- start:103 stop:411 length:309 start_codon:yes stop_codon:yes gene_type:complete